MAESSPNGFKGMREKEKLLVTSNFSFSHSLQKTCTAYTQKTRACLGSYNSLERGSKD